MLPVYPRMKDSGVEWLGQLPEHWGIAPLKYRLLRNDGGVWGDEPDSENNTVVLRSTDQTVDGHWRGDDPAVRRLSASDRQAALLKEGDLLITKSSGSSLHIGKTSLVTREIAELGCCFSNFMQRITPSNTLLPKFLWYFMNSQTSRAQLDYMSNTTTGLANLNGGIIGGLIIGMTGKKEQESIVTFLDRKTGLIENLIAKRERQIELLQEQRTALISRAVSKGPNPDVPMKDSGVEWLGKVPEHWNVAPVYSRYEVQLGKMLDEKQITGKHLAPYLRNVDVQWDRVNVIDLPLMDFDPGDRQKFALKSGDLLVCEGGEVGRAALWGGNLEECYYQKALHRVRPRSDRDDPRFFFYLLYAASKNDAFVVGGNQTTIGHLTADKLRKHRLPFPSRGEQGEISAFLDRETTKIDTFVAKVRQSIEKLREYRQSLISAAVTGKIDVRGHAAYATSLEVPV